MVYLATSINESPVYVDKAGAAIEDVRGRAVKFDAEGNIVLCAAGEAPLGVGIMTNDKNIAAGEDVHIQIKDIGLVHAGAAIKKGMELAADVNGDFVEATSGFVAAIAMQEATKAGVYIKARLETYKKSGTAEETGSGATIGGVEYETIQAAIEAAGSGETVKLMEDMAVTEKLTIDKDLTIDLNGKTLTTPTDIWAKSGTLTILNGTVKAEEGSDAFIVGDYLGGTEKATGDTNLVIGEGVTIIVTGDNCNCVYVRGTDYNASVETSGDLQTTGVGAAAIQGNGKSKGNVTIKGGTIRSEQDVAIYHPQDGTLKIEGGEISGKVGVEIRAGELIVTGGTISGDEAAFSGMTANGNGTTVASGAAVAVSQHSNNKALNVNISEGTLKGYYALYEEDVQDESTGDGIIISITGGTFDGRISSENVAGFISGGMFANAITAEQCAEGVTPSTEPNERGYYTVA